MAEFPDPKPRAGALTKAEREFFAILQHNAPKLALVRTELDGKPASAIAFVFPPGDDGQVQIVPAAVLVDKAMFKRLKDPQVAR